VSSIIVLIVGLCILAYTCSLLRGIYISRNKGNQPVLSLIVYARPLRVAKVYRLFSYFFTTIPELHARTEKNNPTLYMCVVRGDRKRNPILGIRTGLPCLWGIKIWRPGPIDWGLSVRLRRHPIKKKLWEKMMGGSGEFLLVLASIISESRGTHDHILLSQDSGSILLRAYSLPLEHVCRAVIRCVFYAVRVVSHTQ
jgi:hypothetical protein